MRDYLEPSLYHPKSPYEYSAKQKTRLNLWERPISFLPRAVTLLLLQVWLLTTFTHHSANIIHNLYINLLQSRFGLPVRASYLIGLLPILNETIPLSAFQRLYDCHIVHFSGFFHLAGGVYCGDDKLTLPFHAIPSSATLL